DVGLVAERFEKSKSEPSYRVVAGIMPMGANHQFPQLFYFSKGTYQGGTDSIGQVRIKGVVQIAPDSGEIALLTQSGNAANGTQDLIRYRRETQRIETIQ